MSIVPRCRLQAAGDEFSDVEESKVKQAYGRFQPKSAKFEDKSLASIHNFGSVEKTHLSNVFGSGSIVRNYSITDLVDSGSAEIIPRKAKEANPLPSSDFGAGSGLGSAGGSGTSAEAVLPAEVKKLPTGNSANSGDSMETELVEKFKEAIEISRTIKYPQTVLVVDGIHVLLNVKSLFPCTVLYYYVL